MFHAVNWSVVACYSASKNTVVSHTIGLYERQWDEAAPHAPADQSTHGMWKETVHTHAHTHSAGGNTVKSESETALSQIQVCMLPCFEDSTHHETKVHKYVSFVEV